MYTKISNLKGRGSKLFSVYSLYQMWFNYSHRINVRKIVNLESIKKLNYNNVYIEIENTDNLEKLYDLSKQASKNWTSSRSKPIRVLTPNILLAQMKVHSLGFNRTEAVFSIGTLPAQEKTELFFLAPKSNI